MNKKLHKRELKTLLESRAKEKLYHLKEKYDLTQPDKIPDLIESLHLHQIELEMQQEELIVTQKSLEDEKDKLKEEKDKYLELYNSSPIPLITLNKNDLITEINICGQNLLSNRQSLVIGHPIHQYIAKGNVIEFNSKLKFSTVVSSRY